MNKERRKKLNKIKEKIEEIIEELQKIQGEEEDAMDNIPESLMESERYENMETAVSFMEDAADNLEEAVSNIECAAE